MGKTKTDIHILSDFYSTQDKDMDGSDTSELSPASSPAPIQEPSSPPTPKDDQDVEQITHENVTMETTSNEWVYCFYDVTKIVHTFIFCFLINSTQWLILNICQICYWIETQKCKIFNNYLGTKKSAPLIKH